MGWPRSAQRNMVCASPKACLQTLMTLVDASRMRFCRRDHAWTTSTNDETWTRLGARGLVPFFSLFLTPHARPVITRLTKPLTWLLRWHPRPSPSSPSNSMVSVFRLSLAAARVAETRDRANAHGSCLVPLAIWHLLRDGTSSLASRSDASPTPPRQASHYYTHFEVSNVGERT